MKNTLFTKQYNHVPALAFTIVYKNHGHAKGITGQYIQPCNKVTLIFINLRV